MQTRVWSDTRWWRCGGGGGLASNRSLIMRPVTASLAAGGQQQRSEIADEPWASNENSVFKDYTTQYVLCACLGACRVVPVPFSNRHSAFTFHRILLSPCTTLHTQLPLTAGCYTVRLVPF